MYTEDPGLKLCCSCNLGGAIMRLIRNPEKAYKDIYVRLAKRGE